MKRLLLVLVFIVSGLLADIGNIMAVKGEAKVLRDGEEIVAVSGLALLRGDNIITQARSRVQVMLKDETVVTIGAKSKFSFDEYLFDGANSKVAMSSSRGFFRSVTGRIGKLAPQRFKVKTASATIGIRGTDFWGVTGGEREKFTCNRGKIVVKFDGGERVVVAGRFLEIGPGGVKEGKQGAGKGNGKSDGSSKKKTNKKESKTSKKDNASSRSVSKGGVKILAKAIKVDGAKVEIRVKNLADVVKGTTGQANIAGVTKVVEPFTMTLGSEDRPVEY